VCQAATTCVAGQEEVNKLTATSDRSCRVCPAGKTDADSNPSTACMACGAGHFVPEGSTSSCESLQCALGSTDVDSNPATSCVECDGTSEYSSAAGRAGACAAMTVCQAGEEMTLEGTASSNRECQACSAGSFSPSGGPCLEWSTCAEHEQELRAPSATEDRTCECQVWLQLQRAWMHPDCWIRRRHGSTKRAASAAHACQGIILLKLLRIGNP